MTHHSPHLRHHFAAHRSRLLLLLALCAAFVIAALGRVQPTRAAFPGVDGLIAFTSTRDGYYQIYTINADGTGQTNLSNNADGDYDPAWSPDGTRIVFSSERDGNYEIYVMNADGSGQTRLTTNSDYDDTPAWSPDGSKIAFTSDRDGNLEIYVMNADGTGQVNLSNNAAADRYPVWSPDGARIAFASERDGDSEIYVMNPNGSSPTNLTNDPDTDDFPDWSPDGSQIVFNSNRDGIEEIYVMDADGSNPTRLTTNAAYDATPVWSPSGTQIAFTSNRDGNYETYIMNADGTGQTNLSDDPDIDWLPDWQPVANLIITKATDPAGGTDFPFILDPAPYAFAFKWGVLNANPNPPVGTFDEPIGVAIDTAGNVFVADTDNDRVQKFDADGNFLATWGFTGSGNGDFSLPWGIAVDGTGRVYVADTNNNRIQRFSNNGAYQTQWGSPGGGAGQFNQPQGVTIGPDGRVYVADTNNHRIQVFDSNGGFIMAFGENVVDGGGTGFEICLPADTCQAGALSSAGGGFNEPTDVAVNASGIIYVVDIINHRVQRFNSDGSFLDNWGSNGGGNGQFFFPFGIAVDKAGSVYVTDQGNGRVQKFTAGGDYLTQWGSLGSGDGQFNSNRGIEVAPTGLVYIGDTFNDRIQVFESDGSFTLDDGESMPLFLPPGTHHVGELVPPGWELTEIACDGGGASFNGATLTLTMTVNITASCTFTNTLLPPPETVVYMSTRTAGTTGDGLNFGSEDIIKWDGVEWSEWFDGSAAGLEPKKAKHNINAFWIPDASDDDFVFSFAQNRRRVPGIDFPVDGMDLLMWDGSTFSFWFDGSDVFLTNKTQEKIDALHVLDGSESPIGAGCVAYLLVSTQGPGKVPNYSGGQIKFGGEDVLGFCATSLGQTTTGLWHLLIDGSAEGMPRNSTDSISLSEDGQTLYLTTQGAFAVDAAAGGHSMVYAYDMGGGTFSGPVFDAPASGLPEKVNGLH